MWSIRSTPAGGGSAGEKRVGMKITNKEYTKTAQKALKDTYGFAPALKDISILESGDDGMIITSIAFAVGKKGYCWSLGNEAERCELYNLN